MFGVSTGGMVLGLGTMKLGWEGGGDPGPVWGCARVLQGDMAAC